MMILIIGLGILLVLLILYAIFRITNLLDLLKDQKEGKKWISGNNAQAYLFLLCLVVGLASFFFYSYDSFDKYDIPVASQHGLVTDHMFWVSMLVGIVASIGVFIALFWIVFKYRYDANRRAHFYPDNHKIEIVWTVIPAAVLALLFLRGLDVWSDITGPASEKAEVIELVGQQFAWTVRYPGIKDQKLGHVDYRLIDAVNEFGLDMTDKNAYDDFKSLELHLPKGKEVLLQIRSKDVIHSVYLPHFRVKMDAVPGMVTSFKFTPIKSTQDMRLETGNSEFDYEMACAELCGTGHFSMRLIVKVDEPEDYEQWKQEQQSWLKQNPEYMVQVPQDLKQVAIAKSNLSTVNANQAVINISETPK